MTEEKQLDGLTFKEMRFKMCRFLEQQGIVNDLRALLRCKFVEALKISTQSTKRSSHTLLHQVVLWLIREYLTSRGYDYTLCTLACESGVVREPFTAQDMAKLLHVPPVTKGPLLEGIVATHLLAEDIHMRAPEEATELEKLRHSLADAQRELRAIQEQLRAVQPPEEDTRAPRRCLQAPHHVSVLTQLSGSTADLLLLHPEASTLSNTSSKQPRSMSSSSVIRPLEATRRRLQQLSLQTEYLEEKLRALSPAESPPPVTHISDQVSFASC